MDVKSGEEKIVKSSLMSDLIEPGDEECRMRFYYHFTFETDHPRDNSTSSPKIISAIRLSVRYVRANLQIEIVHTIPGAESCKSELHQIIAKLNCNKYFVNSFYN